YYLTCPMVMDARKPFKIAVVGPESTGKSTVSLYLADVWNTICVPEYAREYCRGLERQYTLEDEINIYRGQLKVEEKLLAKTDQPIVIMDTMVLTVKIWCDHLFGHTPQEVVDTIQENRYDFYLLMDIDLPWEDDELRDFPNLRRHFMDIWQKEL